MMLLRVISLVILATIVSCNPIKKLGNRLTDREIKEREVRLLENLSGRLLDVEEQMNEFAKRLDKEENEVNGLADVEGELAARSNLYDPQVDDDDEGEEEVDEEGGEGGGEGGDEDEEEEDDEETEEEEEEEEDDEETEEEEEDDEETEEEEEEEEAPVDPIVEIEEILTEEESEDDESTTSASVTEDTDQQTNAEGRRVKLEKLKRKVERELAIELLYALKHRQ